MLRKFLIYLSQAEWARHMARNWKLTWKVASRFVAGETLEEALNAIQVLNEDDINATLDHLGEHVSTREEAVAAAGEILKLLDGIDRTGVRTGVSIKLSQIGLGTDNAVCEENLRAILERVKEQGNFLRIDMEDSPFTDITLDLFFKMQEEGFADHVGIVIQSYLYRSEEDVRKILEKEGGIRICKGAYSEPIDVAFPQKGDVDENFDLLTRIIMDASLELGSRISPDKRTPPIPAIATHDEDRIDYAKAYAAEIDLPKEGFEFQMLYGIRSDIQRQLVAEGYLVRVYVPYGTEWYPYFVRRLAERPANVWFFISNFFRG
ncbi:MAG: Proline dehydrogenase [Chloroflexi bacterium]|nr:Proline dehydrogenase [Chloroflexota bacterium]